MQQLYAEYEKTLDALTDRYRCLYTGFNDSDRRVFALGQEIEEIMDAMRAIRKYL